MKSRIIHKQNEIRLPPHDLRQHPRARGDNKRQMPHDFREPHERHPPGVLDQLDAMMSFHGVDNGLSDIRGLYRFQDFVQRLGPDYGRKYAIHPIAEHGHQDCLVGIHSRERVFPLVERFFQEQA